MIPVIFPSWATKFPYFPWTSRPWGTLCGWYSVDCGVVSVGADDVLKAQGVTLDDSRVRLKTETVSFDEQQRRASAINDIENSDFVQSTFKSSRSEVSWLHLSFKICWDLKLTIIVCHCAEHTDKLSYSMATILPPIKFVCRTFLSQSGHPEGATDYHNRRCILCHRSSRVEQLVVIDAECTFVACI